VHSIRLVASYGEGFDGAIDLSAAACLRYAAAFPDDGLERARSAPAAPPRIITADRNRHFAPVFHLQSTLMAAALDVAARAKIGRETPILCTLPPTTFAGLVAGPFAALLSGTALHLHGPFHARDFLQTRDKLTAPHLVMPIEIAQDMVRANVIVPPASAILVSRRTANEALRLPEQIEAACSLIDLYAIDETAAIAEERRGGTPLPPAQEPHFIGFDDARILAVAAMPQAGNNGLGNNGLVLQGAAVSTT
jgi:hypothetical protein